LLKLKQKIENNPTVQSRAPNNQSCFNSVLINLYRNEQDSVGYHSDDEPELGRNPFIASLSLGAPRTFVMKWKKLEQPDLRITLETGSLLLMHADCQHVLKHALPKQSSPCGPRLNLSFRRVAITR
jgi:alkylated DNA repair dioxygenase AlkB